MSNENILHKIVKHKKEEVEQQKKIMSIEQIRDALESIRPARSIVNAIKRTIVCGRLALIAEIKKASPSKGIIREDFNPLDLAMIYEQSGATAISVLTDDHFFKGSLEYLKVVSDNVNIPVLRKDFIIDPYQIFQARYYGADFILLIQSILSKAQVDEYEKIANTLGMECLIETHSPEEFDYHHERKTTLIGINNRNLNTFQTDLNHTLKLIEGKHLCKSFVISESGINTKSDIAKLSNTQIAGVLIGEHFMRQDDVSKALSELF